MFFNEQSNLPELVKQYLYYITTIKNRTIKTAKAYAVDLRSFFKFYKLHKKMVPIEVEFKNIKVNDVGIELIKQVTLIDVYEFLNYFMIENDNSPKARARKISSIRGFFKYLTFNLKLLNENPVKNLESPTLKKSVPNFLSIDESLKLLAVQSKVNSKTKFRDYSILTLFLNCGLRLSEMESLNLNSLKIEERSLKIFGKGEKERLLYLNKACLVSLENYFKFERSKIKNNDKEKAIFLASRTGKRLSARQIQKIVERALQNADLNDKGYSPHKLRHTAATLLYRYGKVDLLVLKELLGHSNVGTTEIYTHVANESLEQAMSKNPLSDEHI